MPRLLCKWENWSSCTRGNRKPLAGQGKHTGEKRLQRHVFKLATGLRQDWLLPGDRALMLADTDAVMGLGNNVGLFPKKARTCFHTKINQQSHLNPQIWKGAVVSGDCTRAKWKHQFFMHFFPLFTFLFYEDRMTPDSPNHCLPLTLILLQYVLFSRISSKNRPMGYIHMY